MWGAAQLASGNNFIGFLTRDVSDQGGVNSIAVIYELYVPTNPLACRSPPDRK